MRTIVYLIFWMIFLASASYAADKATPLEVVQKVIAAADFLAQDRLNNLNNFNDPKSEWTWGDTYVFVLDCSKITVAAHPFQPSLIGKPLAELKDVNGKLFFVELCDAAKTNGWVEYYWPKPGAKKSSRKISYMRQVPGSQLQVGAGLYEDILELEELIEFTEEYFSYSTDN